MTADTFSHPKAAMPIDFRFFCADHANALFSIGPAQNVAVEITNTSRANLTLRGEHDHKTDLDTGTLALAFRPGVLKVKDRHEFTVTQKGAPEWSGTVKRAKVDLTDHLILTPQMGQTLSPGQSITLSIAKMPVDTTRGSYGTIVALECRNITQDGALGTVSNTISRRVDVLQQLPFELSHLDDLVKDREVTIAGLADKQQAMGLALEKMRDTAVHAVSAKIIGSASTIAGHANQMSISLVSELATTDPSDLSYFELPKNAKITVQSENARLHVTELAPINKKTGRAATPQDAKLAIYTLSKGLNFKRDKKVKTLPHQDFVMKITPDPNYWATETILITLFGGRMKVPRTDASGAPLRTKSNRVSYKSQPVPAFSLALEVKVGSIQPCADGVKMAGAVSVTGAIALEEGSSKDIADKKPLRLFQDKGWNFTLPPNPSAKPETDRALRVGPSDAKGAGDMDAFSVTTRRTTVGAKTRKQPADLTIAAAKGHRSGLALTSGDTRFEMRTQKRGVAKLTIAPVDNTGTPTGGLTILGKNGNVGIGKTNPYHPFEVEGVATASELRASTAEIDGELTAETLVGLDEIRTEGTLTIETGGASLQFAQGAIAGRASGWQPSDDRGLFIETASGKLSSGIFMNGKTMAFWSSGTEDLLRIYNEDTLVAPSYGKRGKISPKLSLTASGSLNLPGNISLGGKMSASGALIGASLLVKGLVGESKREQSWGRKTARNNAGVESGGYQEIGNFMIQWGRITSDLDGDHTVNFCKSFKPGSKPFVLATREEGGDNIGVKSAKAASFIFHRGSDIDGINHVDWVAFGTANT